MWLNLNLYVQILKSIFFIFFFFYSKILVFFYFKLNSKKGKFMGEFNTLMKKLFDCVYKFKLRKKGWFPFEAKIIWNWNKSQFIFYANVLEYTEFMCSNALTMTGTGQKVGIKNKSMTFISILFNPGCKYFRNRPFFSI